MNEDYNGRKEMKESERGGEEGVKKEGGEEREGERGV